MTEFHALTKMDIAAIRQCDHLVVRSDPKAAVYATKRIKKQANNPFGSDEAVYSLAIPVRIAAGWRHDATNATAFEMIWNFPTQVTHTGSVFATLKVGDGVAFVFAADDHSTEAMRDAGFHGDVLRLVVRRAGKQVAEWDLVTRCCSNNSSRMIKGTVERAPVAA